jgi:CubicO group peptidase (beta-lactamase class C family)
MHRALLRWRHLPGLLGAAFLLVVQTGWASSSESAVDAMVAPFLCSPCGGIAVAIMRNGCVILKKGYGSADIERHSSIRAVTVFDLASLTKQFTGIAVLMLAERGRLSMHDDIRTHLPGVLAFDPHPTIQIINLSQHTSGLPEFPQDASGNTDAARLEWLSGVERLDFPPGSKWEYRNANYYLLARIVEQVSMKTFRSFLEEEVFARSGMRDAQILDKPDRVIRNRATGYCFGKPCRDDNGLTGPGGVFASLNDMIAWDAVLRSGKLVPLAAVLDATKPVGYGLGWRLVSHGGRRAMEHDGDAIGTRTSIVRYLDPQLTIIILSNQTRTDVDGLQARLAHHFL